MVRSIWIAAVGFVLTAGVAWSGAEAREEAAEARAQEMASQQVVPFPVYRVEYPEEVIELAVQEVRMPAETIEVSDLELAKKAYETEEAQEKELATSFGELARP
jgi:hypothetical protein